MKAVEVVFYLFAFWAVASALLCITRSNAIAAALWLVSCIFALAAIFVLLQAQFIAAIQVLVYAGAVMVLFLFVIMLLNLEATPRDWKRWPGWVVGTGLAAVLGATLISMRAYSPERLASEMSTIPGADPRLVFADGSAMVEATVRQGVVGGVAQPMFAAYLVPFEVTSVLLLAAVVGAVVLAKKKL